MSNNSELVMYWIAGRTLLYCPLGRAAHRFAAPFCKGDRRGSATVATLQVQRFTHMCLHLDFRKVYTRRTELSRTLCLSEKLALRACACDDRAATAAGRLTAS